jgi:hypothetical protein
MIKHDAVEISRFCEVVMMEEEPEPGTVAFTIEMGCRGKWRVN